MTVTLTITALVKYEPSSGLVWSRLKLLTRRLVRATPKDETVQRVILLICPCLIFNVLFC